MRTRLILTGLVIVASAAFAREPKHYQTGTLLRMHAVPCGVAEKDGKSITGELLGTDSGSKKSKDVLCQEYDMQTDAVLYRLRPEDDKHPVLLSIGAHVQFRIEKDIILLRMEDLDNKDRKYQVVSMEPRETGAVASSDAADAGRHQLAAPQK